MKKLQMKNMNKTATIYSKDEALAMKPQDRPMCFRVPSKIYHDSFEAVGAASNATEPSTLEKVAVDLLFNIASELEKAGLAYENWPDAWRESDPKGAESNQEGGNV